jgi:hypothetical protein
VGYIDPKRTLSIGLEINKGAQKQGHRAYRVLRIEHSCPIHADQSKAATYTVGLQAEPVAEIERLRLTSLINCTPYINHSADSFQSVYLSVYLSVVGLDGRWFARPKSSAARTAESLKLLFYEAATDSGLAVKA